jgi:hypothetical protein
MSMVVGVLASGEGGSGSHYTGGLTKLEFTQSISGRSCVNKDALYNVIHIYTNPSYQWCIVVLLQILEYHIEYSMYFDVCKNMSSTFGMK